MTAEEIIGRYAACARPLILRYYVPNCCVAATRVTIEVLRRFGVEAQAVPMQLIVQCHARKLAFVTGLSPELREALAQRNTFMPSEEQNGWNGHLVAVASHGRRRYVIDASFDQAAKTGMQIEPQVLAFPLDDQDIPSDSIMADLELVTDAGDTLNVQYLPLRDDSWLFLPAWEPEHFQTIVSLICDTMYA